MRIRMHPTASDWHPADREHRAVIEHLARWEARALLTPHEAEAIRAYERQEAGPPKRVPLVAEALGYLGAALAVAAVAALLGPRWNEMSHTAHLIMPAVGAAVLLVAGWAARTMDEPAVGRLVGVLWTLSAACVAAFLAVLLFDQPAGEEAASWAVFALGLGAGIYARVLHAFRPCIPLQVALYGATLTAVGGAGLWAADAGWTWLDRNPNWFGVMMLVLSALWLAAGRFGVIEPRGTAVVIGALGVVLAPRFAVNPVGFGLVLGAVASGALIAASVGMRNTVMLALGALGLFGYLTGTIVYFLSDTAGVPAALLLSGVVLLGLAIATTRLKRFTGGPSGVR